MYSPALHSLHIGKPLGPLGRLILVLWGYIYYSTTLLTSGKPTKPTKTTFADVDGIRHGRKNGLHGTRLFRDIL